MFRTYPASASVSAAEPDRHMIVRSFSAHILSDARFETYIPARASRSTASSRRRQSSRSIASSSSQTPRSSFEPLARVRTRADARVRAEDHAAGVFARDDGRPRVRGLARVRVARVEAHVDVERAIVSRGGRARSHISTPTSRDRETARSDERNNRRGSRRARVVCHAERRRDKFKRKRRSRVMVCVSVFVTYQETRGRF